MFDVSRAETFLLRVPWWRESSWVGGGQQVIRSHIFYDSLASSLSFTGELTRDPSEHIKLSVFITSQNLLRVTPTDFGFRIISETLFAMN